MHHHPTSREIVLDLQATLLLEHNEFRLIGLDIQAVRAADITDGSPEFVSLRATI
jgi:hypothetical protein